MRTWTLDPSGPLCLRLAADVRTGDVDYLDDQIWELSLGGGEPSALALETSYGLRARQMRIFPLFGWGDERLIDPGRFVSPPLVRSIHTNYLALELIPFEGLQVVAEYWVPDSHTLAGRYTLTNSGSRTERYMVRLQAVLRPGENPQIMSEATRGGATILAGRSGPIEPVIFMSAGAIADRSNYPGLVVEGDLSPEARRSIIWVHSGLGSLEESFEACRRLAGRNWDAEIARLELTNASLVDIETGEADWDAVLALSQKAAMACFVRARAQLPHPSIVMTRLPKQGYSPRKNGKDYDSYWDGQTACHAYLSAMQMLPAEPKLAEGLLRNFLATQHADGTIDGKPGMAGQRSGSLSLPLLATLTWMVYQQSRDRAFLQDSFSRLTRFLELWFSKEHDRDQDGYPEWDHTLQACFDDWPTFVRWRQSGQGLDITKAETPDLASYLYRECRSLLLIAKELELQEDLSVFEERARKLKALVESSWDDETATYRPVDRDLNVTVGGRRLGEGRGSFALEVDQIFDPQVRVQIRSTGPEGLAHPVQVFIHGRGSRGRHRVERMGEEHFQWFWTHGSATSEKTYAEIERIEIQGLSEEFETVVSLADFSRQDVTNLLPLWAGIPGEARAERLLHESLLDPERFWRPFGVPSCSASDPDFEPDENPGSGGVNLFWNALLIQGMVEYGFIDQAAELLERLMRAAIESLRAEKAFRQHYHPDQPHGLGERDHLAGLIPVNLFLMTLGVRLISPQKVCLRGRNPFPWPVTVRWRGLHVYKDERHTVVTFPDGQQAEVSGEEEQLVEQLH